MRLNTGIKVTLVAAAVALGGFGLGLRGGTETSSAGDAGTSPVVAIDRQADPQPSAAADHDRLDCPGSDRAGRSAEPTSGHDV